MSKVAGLFKPGGTGRGTGQGTGELGEELGEPGEEPGEERWEPEKPGGAGEPR